MKRNVTKDRENCLESVDDEGVYENVLKFVVFKRCEHSHHCEPDFERNPPTHGSNDVNEVVDISRSTGLINDQKKVREAE